MSGIYRIDIPELIDEKMSQWEITPEMLQMVDDRLRNDLKTDPSKHLRRVIAPWGERLNLFTFKLSDPFWEHVSYTFMFHLTYSEDETSLVIVECGYLRTDLKPGS